MIAKGPVMVTEGSVLITKGLAMILEERDIFFRLSVIWRFMFPKLKTMFFKADIMFLCM